MCPGQNPRVEDLGRERERERERGKRRRRERRENGERRERVVNVGYTSRLIISDSLSLGQDRRVEDLGW